MSSVAQVMESVSEIFSKLSRHYLISTPRQTFLKGKMTKYKIYEDYLLKTLEYFPKSEFKTAPALPVIEFHHLLSLSNNCGSL